MTRIRFEDLPSTNTPRNAENLNKLNNVVISSTEPTTGEEVWIDNTNKKIYTKNDNGGYEEFYDEGKTQVYSLAEQRIGTWIDGRPVYRRVIQGYVTQYEITHNIANLDDVTHAYGWVVNKGVKFTTADLIHSVIGILSVEAGSIRVDFNADSTDKIELQSPYTVIIEYTKTTD